MIAVLRVHTNTDSWTMVGDPGVLGSVVLPVRAHRVHPQVVVGFGDPPLVDPALVEVVVDGETASPWLSDWMVA